MPQQGRNLGERSSKVLEVTHFTKLKVFYQILMVIGVMSLFFGLQAYLNVGVIRTMQEAIPAILNQGAYTLNEIANLKGDILNVKDAYLEQMTGNTDANTPAVTELLEKINQRTRSLNQIEPGTKERILHKLAMIQTLTENPTADNYPLLRKELSNIGLYLDNAYMGLFSQTLSRVTENDQFSDEAQRNSILIMIASIVLSILLGVFIANSIAGPLKKIAGVVKGIAVGDLTEKVRAAGSPELAVVVNGLNQAIDGLQELVSNIGHQATALFTASKELKATSTMTGQSATEVARSMEQLTVGAEEQARQINQAVATIDQLSETVHQVSQGTDRIATASEKVAQAAQVGREATVAITREITGLYTSTKEVAEVIEILQRSSEEIGEIITLIQAIAEQTALLALNASIEAARAGEQGRGFGVVARETGKLAEQSKQATESITQLILRMKARTNQAVNVIQIGLGRADKGRNLVVQARTTFEEIFTALSENLQQIRAVAALTQKMSHSNQEVIELINGIASFSEESLSSTEQVSATTEEQSASVEQVMALAESLERIADHLRQAVAAFELTPKTNG